MKLAVTLLFVLSLFSTICFAGSLSGNVKTSGQAVVYLEGGAKAAPSNASYRVDQKGMKFVPTFLAIPVGATVEFDNDDAATHNVRWTGHNMGNFNPGQKGSYKFDRPGAIQLLCSMHPDMSGTIFVSPSPYFSVTDSILGDYFIMNIPDGQYKVSVWHKGKVTTQDVTVKGNTKLNFIVK